MRKRTSIAGPTRSKSLIWFVVVVLALILIGAALPLMPSGPDGEPDPGASYAALLAQADRDGTARVIVELDVDAVPEALLPNKAAVLTQQDRIRKAQTRLLDRLRGYFVQRHREYAHLPHLAIEVDATALEAAAADSEVAAVHEDRLMRATLADSTVLIGATEALASGYSGAGQTIAVLDSGVDADHPFLGGKVSHQACFSSTVPFDAATTLCPNGQNTQLGGSAGRPCAVAGCDHGTHVAGIAAGDGESFSGVAPDAGIMAIQVFSRFTGSLCTDFGLSSPCILSYTSDLMAALEHVYAQRGAFDIAAANLSLGGGRYTTPCDSDPLRWTIDLLRADGIATVAAAGNDGYVDAIGAPACVSSAISVGSTTKSDEISVFSNSAAMLDLLAPGSNINSSIPGGGFATFSGTSMATPHVSGAFAVLRSAATGASVDETLNVLQAEGEPILDPDNGLTRSRIQVDLAAEALITTAGTAGALAVTPAGGLTVAGPEGGPFAPASQDYTLENTGTGSIGISVSTGAAWVGALPESGTLSPDATTSVTLSIDAEMLDPGDYATTVGFTNTTNGIGSTGRAVLLTVTEAITGNDKFADATPLVASSGSTLGYNAAATKESGEPDHAGKAGGRSLWWRWTAPEAGDLTLDTLGSGFDTLLAAYTGAGVATLTEVASNEDYMGEQSRIVFDTDAGQTYAIAVDGVGGAGGDIRLNWTFVPGAVPIDPIAVTPESGFTPEGPAGGPFSPASIDYTLTNVSTSSQAFTVTGLPDWLNASATAGALSPAEETEVTLSVNAQAEALAPGEYTGEVAFNTVTRPVRLRITAEPCANDTFATATELSGTSASAMGSNVGATKEAGEPDHAGNAGGRSIWWRWVAPADDRVTVVTFGSAFDTTLGVYTGSTVDSLTPVASNDDAAGTPQSTVTFDATAGVAYAIAVDGFNGESGAVTLSLETGLLRVPLDYPTIQEAVDAASGGDTIRVAIGTYTGTGEEVVLLNKSLKLSGGWDDSFTTQNGMSTIDGEDARRGISVASGVTTAVERFIIHNGKVGGGTGGGILNGGSLTLANSIVTDNRADWGGGIGNYGGTLDLRNSTVYANTASSSGGGIENDGGATMFVTNSTISRNSSSSRGGGIRNEATAIINNSTISDNYTFHGWPGGGGIYAGGTVTLKNSILANNRTTDSDGGPDCYSYTTYSVSTLGYNLIGDTSNCTFTPTSGDLTNVDARTCGLMNNGGPTLTHALLEGSPAIDAGDPAGCTDDLDELLTTDQRGEPRPLGVACDIGAFEGFVAADEVPTEAQEYYPLLPGTIWTYRADGSDPYTEQVLYGTFDVNGVPTTKIADSFGDAEYLTNDCIGLRLHRWDLFDPDWGVTDFFTFKPAIKIVEPTPEVGQVISGSGTATFHVIDIGVFRLDYETTSEVEAIEAVTVPFGSFEAARVKQTRRIFGFILGTGINVTEVYTYWLAKDIGMVKLTIEFDGETFAAELIGMTPPKAILVSPSGTIDDTTPTYTWNAVSDAASYYLWVDDATGNRIKQWYGAADAGCGDGTGTCAVTPGTALAAGEGAWAIQTWNEVGYGPWSGAMAFTVDLGPPPGKATLISPAGTIDDTTPTYTWNAVPGAASYYLWVDDATGNRIRQWYGAADAGCADGTGTCAVTPDTALAAGEGAWAIQTWNEVGYGPWSGAMAFTVDLGPPPGKATLISPAGTIDDTTPTYTWNAVPGAASYYLWVDDATGNRIRQWYGAADAGCADGTGTCAVTPDTALAAGEGAWAIQTWNEVGYGPWSGAMAFTVDLGPPPGKATLISPAGTIDDTTPTYTWNVVPGAASYYLWVDDATGNRIRQWYGAADAGCADGTGTCAVTPDTALAAGEAEWSLQTRNEIGYGPWSGATAFTVDLGPPPGKATLISPAGTIDDTTPTYTWNVVPGAASYYLWVDDATGNRIRQWYGGADAGCGDGTGTCAVTPDTALAAGEAEWSLQTRNEIGYGPWSGATAFTVDLGPPPGKATLISPAGMIDDPTPTYTWNAVPGAASYYLWVDDATGNRIRQWYGAADAGCADATGTCAVTPDTALVPGEAEWSLQTRNEIGYGPWSGATAFTVDLGPPPGKATLISPAGMIDDPTPTYTWNAVPGAASYYLWVDDATGNRIRQWYGAADAGCADATGTCAVTPDTALVPGEAEWSLQTRNEIGYGPWSGATAFTVDLGPPPGKATLISPAGMIDDPTPTYTWNAVPGAASYYLWVDDATGNRIRQWYGAADAGCADATGTCAVTPDTALGRGEFKWAIQTWNEVGFGPWSGPMSFFVNVDPQTASFRFYNDLLCNRQSFTASFTVCGVSVNAASGEWSSCKAVNAGTCSWSLYANTPCGILQGSDTLSLDSGYIYDFVLTLEAGTPILGYLTGPGDCGTPTPWSTTSGPGKALPSFELLKELQTEGRFSTAK